MTSRSGKVKPQDELDKETATCETLMRLFAALTMVTLWCLPEGALIFGLYFLMFWCILFPTAPK